MTTQHSDQGKHAPVTVAIAGGGIAGLFLANALEQGNIPYVLFEAHSDIAPPIGASIGLAPSGLRLLDQIGVLPKVEKFEVPLKDIEYRDGHTGQLLNKFGSIAHLKIELGYNAFFLERQKLLELMYNNIKDKSRVITGQRVTRIEELEDYAIVHTDNGMSAKCQLVAGCDGVRSFVRQQIAKEIGDPNSNGPNYLRTEFSCIYGISNSHPKITGGSAFYIYRKNASLMLFTGLQSTIYWFAFQELAKPLDFTNSVRWSDADIASLSEELKDCPVTEGVTFGDIFRNRTAAIMTSLEEGVAKYWFHGRKVILGDAGHKMVPQTGMGGNLALESAGMIVNILKKAPATSDSGSGPRLLRDYLGHEFQQYSDQRRARAEIAVAAAGAQCREQVRRGNASKNLDTVKGIISQEWLKKFVLRLFEAAKLENWNGGSPRVQYFEERAEKIKESLIAGCSSSFPCTPSNVNHQE